MPTNFNLGDETRLTLGPAIPTSGSATMSSADGDRGDHARASKQASGAQPAFSSVLGDFARGSATSFNFFSGEDLSKVLLLWCDNICPKTPAKPRSPSLFSARFRTGVRSGPDRTFRLTGLQKRRSSQPPEKLAIRANFGVPWFEWRSKC